MSQTKKAPHDSSVSMDDRPCKRCGKDTRHLITMYFRGGRDEKCLECKKTRRLRGGIG